MIELDGVQKQKILAIAGFLGIATIVGAVLTLQEHDKPAEKPPAASAPQPSTDTPPLDPNPRADSTPTPERSDANVPTTAPTKPSSPTVVPVLGQPLSVRTNDVPSCHPDIDLSIVAVDSGKDFPISGPEIPLVDFNSYQALGRGSLVALVTSSCVPDKEDQRANIHWLKEQPKAESHGCYQEASPTTCWVEYDIPHRVNSTQTRIPFDNSIKVGSYKAAVTVSSKVTSQKTIRIVQ